MSVPRKISCLLVLLCIAVPLAAEDDLVVHEWGTFTTFSGSDGVILDFRPLAQEYSDLPSYVLDRANSSGSQISIFAKRRLRARVRMETPVTYFYTNRVRQVNVKVEFPKGLLTEFYPPVNEMLPAFDPKVAYKEGEPMGDSSLNWGTVTLIPTATLVQDITDAKLSKQIESSLAHGAVPHGPNEYHYAEARRTDSALVYVPPAATATPDAGQGFGATDSLG